MQPTLAEKSGREGECSDRNRVRPPIETKRVVELFRPLHSLCFQFPILSTLSVSPLIRMVGLLDVRFRRC